MTTYDKLSNRLASSILTTDKLATLHQSETVLSNKDTQKILNLSSKIKKEMDKMKQTPTKQQYEAALQTVKAYENRQKDLQYVKEQLSSKLQEFTQIKFKVDKDKGEIIFTGVHKESGSLKLAQTVCGSQDIFEESIGKLIAVKRALGEDTSKIVELVESKSKFINLPQNTYVWNQLRGDWDKM